MSTVVEVADAQDQLQELIARARQGEEIILAEAGKARVRLVAMAEEPPNPLGTRQLGLYPGHVDLTAFFEPMSEEELSLWEDGPVFPQDVRGDLGA